MPSLAALRERHKRAEEESRGGAVRGALLMLFVVFDPRQRDTEDLVRFFLKVDEFPSEIEVLFELCSPLFELLYLSVFIVLVGLSSRFLWLEPFLSPCFHLLSPLAELRCIEPFSSKESSNLASFLASGSLFENSDLLFESPPSSLSTIVFRVRYDLCFLGLRLWHFKFLDSPPSLHLFQ